MEITAARSLGGLGATAGPPVAYSWTTAGMVPQLLPWLAILAALSLKPNRGWSAWWIWVPLACLAAGCHWLQPAAPSSPSDRSGETIEALLAVPLAWGFGLAVLWLLASYLGGRPPLRTFLGVLAVLAICMVFSFAALAGWGLVTEPLGSILDPRHYASTACEGVMALPFIVPLVLPAAVAAPAMVLSGLACRGRYRPFGLCLWLFVSLLVIWNAVLALFYILTRTGSSSAVEYAPFLGIGLFMVAATFATWLPFLILAFASPFFRERLKTLLHVNPPGAAQR